MMGYSERMRVQDRWQAVETRDAAADGQFVFAVKTTGIYCRPSCPARRPLRKNVRFFANCEEAEAAGFRACLRCKPRDTSPPRWLDRPATAPRKSFRKLTGLTPRQVEEHKQWDDLKSRLRNGADVTTAMLDAGFGSSSRLYEKASASLGMTPAQYRKGGRGAVIRFATAACRLGYLLLAATERGICAVKLGGDPRKLEQQLREEYPAAGVAEDRAALQGWIDLVLENWGSSQAAQALPLDIRGTLFQMRVWHLLRRIPRGETRTYSEVAAQLKQPRAVRAVAQACAANPAALLVPCHRVIRVDGNLAGYRWSPERKAALLEMERA